MTIGFHPAHLDATVVELLRNAGCLISAKTNMDEFGMGCAHYFHMFVTVSVLLGFIAISRPFAIPNGQSITIMRREVPAEAALEAPLQSPPISAMRKKLYCNHG